MIVLVTKEQVIEKYLQGKVEAQELLKFAIENGESEMIENLQNHIILITMFIDRINQENPTQEELQSFYNIALIGEIISYN